VKTAKDHGAFEEAFVHGNVDRPLTDKLDGATASSAHRQ
jgi:hypothetical protein